MSIVLLIVLAVGGYIVQHRKEIGQTKFRLLLIALLACLSLYGLVVGIVICKM